MIRVTGPLPPRALGGNAPSRNKFQQILIGEARAAYLWEWHSKLKGCPAFITIKLTVDYYYGRDRLRSNRNEYAPLDTDGALRSVKVAIDALVSARVLSNDTYKQIPEITVRLHRGDAAGKRFEVVFTIEELTDVHPEDSDGER